MAYNLKLVFAAVEAQLASDARMMLAAVAANLNIERHTIERAVRQEVGISFREYRQRRLLLAVLQIVSENPMFGSKEIAYRAGYGSREALVRFIKAKSGKTLTDIRKSSTTVTFSSSSVTPKRLTRSRVAS
jgi:AraC-like DNA-binding protein